MHSSPRFLLASACLAAALAPAVSAQIGKTFPSEKQILPDPVTGVPITFLTSSGGSKIYQTHHQWTADGKWLVVHSNLVRNQAMAVNEETGQMVQVTDKGYSGMLCLADHSMNLYFLRTAAGAARGRGPAPADASAVPALPSTASTTEGAAPAAASTPPASTATTDLAAAAIASPSDSAAAPSTDAAATPARGTRGRGVAGAARGPGGPRGPSQIIRVDLGKLFADVAANKIGPATDYEHVCGTIPLEWGAGGDMAIDCTEDYAYFRVGATEAAKHLAPDTKIEGVFGPRNLGAGPAGLGKMNLKTGEVGYIVSVPFQIGHVQTNPWVPGEIVFCWETGGKAPQRTWTVMADGSGLRPLYPEAEYDWVTHEAVITKDEVAIAVLAHRSPGLPETVDWGPKSSTGEHPSGVGIVNLRTHEMRLVGQVPEGDPGRSIWHINGSPDGRWAVADDFQYRLWIIDRKNGEMKVLADLGHVVGSDHIHPTFNADSTKIEVQSAMVSPDGRTLNIAVVPVPDSWLKRTYPETF